MTHNILVSELVTLIMTQIRAFLLNIPCSQTQCLKK